MGVFDNGGESLKRIVDGGLAIARRASGRVLEAAETALSVGREETLAEPADEPPVVARLVVEIRSDGSRTIARGGLEDLTTGQKVAVRADGTSPAQLARSLAGTLVTLPVFAARIARSLKRGDGGEGPGEPSQP